MADQPENNTPKAAAAAQEKPAAAAAKSGPGREQGQGGRRGGGRREGGRRPRRRDDRPVLPDGLQDTLVPGGIFKCSKTVKGGKRFSFGALVVVGDSKGKVGYGYGKAKEVPMAIQKAIKKGQRELVKFPLVGEGTIPHEIHGTYGAAHVVLIPAGPGTGVIAGSTVKTVLEMGGVKNVLTKSFGSNNRKNIVKATLAALAALRSKEQVESLRGVTVS